MTDSLFGTLSNSVQRSIDEAFNKAINSNLPSSRSNSDPAPNVSTTNNSDESGGGGFILDNNEGDFGGGFIVEESDPMPTSLNNPEDLIPFELIPTALQLLDLPPDDDEILAVLRNAASGWSSSSLQTPKPLNPQARFVSRDDWRSVCAVLLENATSDQDRDVSESAQEGYDKDDDSDVFMNDDYGNSNSSGEDYNSDDEYQEERRIFSRNRRGKVSQQRKSDFSSHSPSQTPKKLTKRQYQTCIDAYALFFPDISNEELLQKRIMVSDLQRVSKLLGEKTKAEEMIEMLEMFSTSKDKSMDFNDFTRMMVTARLA